MGIVCVHGGSARGGDGEPISGKLLISHLL